MLLCPPPPPQVALALQFGGGLVLNSTSLDASGGSLRLGLACYLNLSLASVTIVSISSTNAAGQTTTWAVPANSPANTASGSCPARTNQRALRLADFGARALATAGTTINTVLSVAYTAPSSSAGTAAAAAPNTIPAVAALLGAIAPLLNSTAASASSGTSPIGAALGSFVTAAALATGVPASSVTVTTPATAALSSVVSGASPSPAPAASSSSSASGLSGGAIAGIIIALVVIIAAVVLVVVLMQRKGQGPGVAAPPAAGKSNTDGPMPVMTNPMGKAGNY